MTPKHFFAHGLDFIWPRSKGKKLREEELRPPELRGQGGRYWRPRLPSLFNLEGEP